MEHAPLTKAHDHALAASKATKSADTTVAISEHTLAAGEFSNAAQSTTSVEALRTLKLLEQHHRRLSELLKFPSENPRQAADSDTDTNADEKQSAPAKDGIATGDASQKTDKTAAKVPQVPSLVGQQRHSSRDVTSSIASNLASARGIRLKYSGQPLAPSVSGNAAAGDLDSLPRRRNGSRTKMQTMLDSPKSVRSPQESTQRRESGQVTEAHDGDQARDQTDDSYSRFYSSFGSLFNKLSAPLAFAGLPLIAEESSTQDAAPSEPSSPKKSRHRQAPPPPSSGGPDLSKIYSKATLRLMQRDSHSASDSFYVVPPSGHTVSYANILTFAEKEKRRMETSSHTSSTGDTLPEEDEDDFVDARENPTQLLSPAARKRVGRARSERDLSNAIEELCLENKSLKDMLDKLSRRLQAFEASAQSSSLALAESMRLMRPGSPQATGQSGAGDDGKGRAEVEERLAAAMKRVEALERDNAKMQKTLARYREKWEQLKESAKARRGQTPVNSPALGGSG
ncbi:hypothetical protein VUR80DRAFT_3425 [Thermomyces stellatus]